MSLLLRQLPSRWLRNCRRISGEVAPASGRLTDLSGLGPKRFYKEVDVSKLDDGSYTIILDGRCVRTPRRSLLKAPCESLAVALASEWDAQNDRIRPSSMPLTTLVSTAHDIVPEFRPRIITSILNYLDTDTICIRPSHPENLVRTQEDLFSPILRHFKEKRNLELNISVGGLSATQSSLLRTAISNIVHSLDNLSLAAFDSATATSKSITVAVALHACDIDAETAAKAARSEEGWQESIWGTVEGGHDLDAADVLVRLAAASLIFRIQALQAGKLAFT